MLIVLLLVMPSTGKAAGDYSGDERCPLPTDWSNYSKPYEPQDHPHDYPAFEKADMPGWSCSYQREDGIFVQYGDSRSPQQQWLDMWGGSNGQTD